MNAVTHILYIVRRAGMLSPRFTSAREAELAFGNAATHPETVAVYLYEYRDRQMELVRSFVPEASLT